MTNSDKTPNKLVSIRAAEEVQEHGNVDRALEAIQQLLDDPDALPRDGRLFMRRVAHYIRHNADKY